MSTTPAVYGGHGPGILATGWTFFTVTTILLALRIYVRLRITTQGGWALIWTIVGYVTTTIELIIMTVDVSHGLGNHLVILEQAGEVSNFLFYTWMVCFWFDLNVPVGKFSAVSLLLAVHQQTHPKRRYLLHFIAISNFLLAFPNFFLLWFQCSPPQALWNPLEQDKCARKTPQINYTRFLGAWSALSDLVMAFLPALLVWSLQMPRKLKVIISFLMGLGIFAALSALMVVYYLKDLESSDPSYELAYVFYWGKATTWLVLISASVPPTYPLFKPFFERHFNLSKNGGAVRLQRHSSFARLNETHPQTGGSGGNPGHMGQRSSEQDDFSGRSDWSKNGTTTTSVAGGPAPTLDEVERVYLGNK